MRYYSRNISSLIVRSPVKSISEMQLKINLNFLSKITNTQIKQEITRKKEKLTYHYRQMQNSIVDQGKTVHDIDAVTVNLPETVQI